MCTHPLTIQVKNKVTNQVRLYTVPCGKCYECLGVKRGELATSSVLNAHYYGSMWFLTMTYDNEHCPLRIVERLVEYGEVVRQSEPFVPPAGFPVEDVKKDMISAYRNSSYFTPRSPNALFPVSYTSCRIDDDVFLDYVVSPSLERRDFRLWLKNFRVQYNRHHTEPLPEFKYVTYGEYGDRTSRPHFHCCVYGLGYEHIVAMALAWKKRFGNCDYHFIPCFNKDGSPAYVRTAKYCSKYMSKMKFSLANDLEGFVQKPRKLVSLNFSTLSIDDYNKLRPYYLAFDVNGGEYDPCTLRGLSCDPVTRNNVLSEVLSRKKRITLDGSSLLLPRKIQNYFFACPKRSAKSYFQKKNIAVRSFGSYVSGFKQSPLQVLLVEFARTRYIENIVNQLRQNTGKDIHELSYKDFKKIEDIETLLLQARDSFAKTSYLNNLKNQKYA